MGDPNSDGGRRAPDTRKLLINIHPALQCSISGTRLKMATPNRCSAGTKTNRNSVPWMVRARSLFGVLIKTVNCGCVTIRCSSMAEEGEMGIVFRKDCAGIV